MKKTFILILLLLITACEAGNFGSKRERLYEMNSDKEICEKHPERCISGVSW